MRINLSQTYPICFSIQSFFELTPLQKKVYGIAILALSCITTLYLFLSKRIFKINKKEKSEHGLPPILDVKPKEGQANDEAEKKVGLKEVAVKSPFLERKNKDELLKTEEISESRKSEEPRNRVLQLKELRLQHPDQYPPYFDELLDKGCSHLYDHLIRMGELDTRIGRQNEIEKMEFSTLASVILEIRKMVIEKVKNSMGGNCQTTVFVLGDTGCGKSTALCYLSGDKMVLHGRNYESKSDKNQYISHSLSNSFTFLPNIVVENNCAIVDFPGFNDSRGQVISLGIELALKALINEYHPKILLLESITNTEGRYKALDELVSRMNRILANKNDCILGLTKYSNHVDFIRLKIIEEAERRKQLSDKVSEKARLENLLQLLKTLPQTPEVMAQINDLERSLKKLGEDKNPGTSLEDTDEKRQHRANIEEEEKAFLRYTGLNKLIRFKELERSDGLKDCFKTLLEANTVRLDSKLTLDSDDERLLDKLFEMNLLARLESDRSFHSSFGTIQDFESSIVNDSFIHTITKRKFPDVDQFLHLSEVNKGIINRYDRKIIHYFVERNMALLVNKMNLLLIEEMSKKLEGSQDILEPLNNKLMELKRYILRLKGSDVDMNVAANIEKEWKKISHSYLIKGENKKLASSHWKSFEFSVPWEFPLQLYLKQQKTEPKETTEKITIDDVNQLIQYLENAKTILMTLKRLEDVITKKQ